MNYTVTKVEQAFIKQQAFEKQTTKVPYITVDNFPQLGLLTSLRFLEWVNESPKLRATHGLIFYKEMDVDTFLLQAR